MIFHNAVIPDAFSGSISSTVLKPLRSIYAPPKRLKNKSAYLFDAPPISDRLSLDI
ncbi:MAG: hypothetical protein ACJAQT_002687 [Akkermansiaceae bacterium]|jgi:hypothetical protein